MAYSDYDSVDKYPLHDAAFRDDPDAIAKNLPITRLLRSACERRDSDGLTPLHWAARRNAARAARVLLRNGADPNAVAGNGSKDTALHLSIASADSPELVGLLLAAGADQTMTNGGGRAPLYFARLGGRAGCVGAAHLLEGWTPLHTAVTMRLSANRSGATDADIVNEVDRCLAEEGDGPAGAGP